MKRIRIVVMFVVLLAVSSAYAQTPNYSLEVGMLKGAIGAKLGYCSDVFPQLKSFRPSQSQALCGTVSPDPDFAHAWTAAVTAMAQYAPQWPGTIVDLDPTTKQPATSTFKYPVTGIIHMAVFGQSGYPSYTYTLVMFEPYPEYGPLVTSTYGGLPIALVAQPAY